jgi:hypothetical protein
MRRILADRYNAPGMSRLAVLAITLAFAWLCVAFVRQPTLASLADDSVSYLVMAQVFSPWQGASAPVAETFAREGFYPPLFPLLLAAVGAAHDVASSYMVGALLLAACLPLVFLLGRRWLGSDWAAVAATALVALLPALWIQAKGILSEPLFCLVLLALLYALERGAKWPLLALMAALVLTRTVGLAALAGYAVWAVFQKGNRVRLLLPVFAGFVAYAVWVFLRPSDVADANTRLLREHAQAFRLADLGGMLATQVTAIAEAWVGSLMLFWVEGAMARVLLAGAVGVLAAAGLIMRFVAGKPDAWIVAAYLATFLVWPFYDQMMRFIFPVVPVLVLYAFFAVGLLKGPRGLVYGVLTVLVASLAAPALGFIHNRAKAEGRHATMTDWYRRPGLDDARARADVQLDLLDDMDEIRRLTQPGQRVMWVVPSYIALLAERRGVAAPPSGSDPEAYRRAVREAKPDFFFLSRYHPRDTTRDAAWRTAIRALDGPGNVVHTRTRNGQVTSTLLKLP